MRLFKLAPRKFKFVGLCSGFLVVIYLATKGLFSERTVVVTTVCEPGEAYTKSLESINGNHWSQPLNTSDILNTTLLREEQVRRKHAAIQFCKTPFNSHTHRLTFTVVYSDKQKLIMCVMPKIASTTWRKLYYAFHLGKMNPRRVHGRDVFQLFKKLNKTEREQKEYEYFSFVLTRHPFTRLVSAFREKIEGKTYYVGLGSSVRTAELLVGVANDTGHLNRPLTFEEFAQSVASGDFVNGHWAPMASMCSPCGLKYDYIAKFETIDMDNIILFTLSGLRDRFQIPAKKPSSTTKLVESYFRNLTQGTIQHLYEFYKADFLAYDYELPDYANRNTLL